MATKKRRKGDLTNGESVVTDDLKKRHGGFIPIIIPTDGNNDCHRHITAIRFGKVSAEIFCKNPERRRELGLPVIHAET